MSNGCVWRSLVMTPLLNIFCKGGPVAQTFSLEIVTQPGQGQLFPLKEGDNMIGRHDASELRRPDIDLESCDPEAKVSRQHACLRVQGATVELCDLGSLNGTFLRSGVRLEPETVRQIADGEEFVIGKTVLRLRNP